MKYIIRRNKEYFNGFVSVHPGTEPIGHLKVQWHECRAWIIEPENLSKVQADLDTLDISRGLYNILPVMVSE